MKEIWLLSRELEGWAEAGGVKDVVRDQAQAFSKVGWNPHVVLPLYGFLKQRVLESSTLEWQGTSAHPSFHGNPWEMWRTKEAGFTLWFLRLPSFENKSGVYTYTADDEVRNPQLTRGQGFLDAYAMNLEFQWATAQFWLETGKIPPYILGHDGHVGFLPAIARNHPGFAAHFHPSHFTILIHNAGQGYRQEMPDTAANRKLINLPPAVLKRAHLENQLEPLVSAAWDARLATVSENYARELLTGKNDHWSGPFGRFLREHKIPLKGINNGISSHDKDPRYPDASKLPVGFDPLKGEWRGKDLCRSFLRERLLLKPSSVYGRMTKWTNALYINQGRLTSQKGVEALADLIERALDEQPDASFIVMAQGERRYEERMTWLARNSVDTGRFLFINKYDDNLARLLFAAGDFLLLPSEYEPCGLTDLKAQLMGTLPIVHRVGGLIKVIDGKTGFSYAKHEKPGFWGVFLKTLELHRTSDKLLDQMRRQAFLSVLEKSDWPSILETQYIPWLTERDAFSIVGHVTPT